MRAGLPCGTHRRAERRVSISRRIARLRSEMEALEVDGFLVSASANRRYLSGFTGSAGYLLIKLVRRGFFATDFRYVEQAKPNRLITESIGQEAVTAGFPIAVRLGVASGIEPTTYDRPHTAPGRRRWTSRIRSRRIYRGDERLRKGVRAIKDAPSWRLSGRRWR